MTKVLRITLSLCMLAHLFAASSAIGASAYLVGNSLTFDGLGNVETLGTGDTGLVSLASQYGQPLTLGYHVDSAQSLRTIWENPDGVDGIDALNAAIGPYSIALPGNDWDYVVLQPHQFTGDPTLGTDKANILDFMQLTRSNSANADTVFYVYETWPTQLQWPFSTYFDGPSIDDDATITEKRRAYFNNLMRWAEQQEEVIRLIPAGDVFYEIEQRILNGEISGVSLADFFRDFTHLDTAIGRYTASATIVSTLLGRDPRDSLTPDSPYFDASEFPAGLLDAINDVIWEVMSSNPWTGLSDFNDDGIADEVDLTVWQNAYGLSSQGDADGDGDTDGLDFLVWQRQRRAAIVAGGTIFAVPEPAGGLIAGYAALIGGFLWGRMVLVKRNSRQN